MTRILDEALKYGVVVGIFAFLLFGGIRLIDNPRFRRFAKDMVDGQKTQSVDHAEHRAWLSCRQLAASRFNIGDIDQRELNLEFTQCNTQFPNHEPLLVLPDDPE